MADVFVQAFKLRIDFQENFTVQLLVQCLIFGVWMKYRAYPCHFATAVGKSGCIPKPTIAVIAAPKPEVSQVCGRSAGSPKMSAVSCMAASLCEPPPATLRRWIFWPLRLSMRSLPSRSAYAKPSSMARYRCARVCTSPKPIMAPLASGPGWRTPGTSKAATSGPWSLRRPSSPAHRITVLARCHVALPTSAHATRIPA
jgi:hypothetical protein